MANEWVNCLLGEVIELKRGYDLPQKDRIPGNVPLVSSSGTTDSHSKAMVKGPGVVTGRYGTLGKVFYIEEDFWPLNTTLYVNDFKGNNPRFISYFLSSFDYFAYSDKAAVPGINRNHLHQAKIWFPLNKTIQQRIADILGALDDKIELNRKQNETLEAMARALFKAWFVDFEPVRAKQDGRWQRGQSLPGLPAHLYDLFPDQLVDSELGEIPQGWGVKSVSQIIHINPTTSLKQGSIAPFISMSMLPTSGFSIAERAYEKYSGGTKFINGDVLLARITPSLENGKTAIVDFLDHNQVGFGSTEFIVLREQNEIKTPFIACLSRLDTFREHCIQSMTGSTGRQRVDNTCFHSFFIAIPDNHILLQQFSSLVQVWFHNISVNSEQSRTLTDLRDTLLPKLLSGEVAV